MLRRCAFAAASLSASSESQHSHRGTPSRWRRLFVATVRSVNTKEHWQGSAGLWRAFGSPLRPNAEDAAIVDALLDAASTRPGVVSGFGLRRAWVLGVTSELAVAARLRDAHVVGLERVPAMIEAAWPGNTAQRQAVCGDWRQPPFPDASFDVALGDGCLTTLPEPADSARFLASVHRCLQPNGCLLLRLFCRPDEAEAPETVGRALREGKIGSFHAFKWRLAMALQASGGGAPVGVDDVWRYWSAMGIAPAELAAQRGWPEQSIATIDFYRGSPARYDFKRYGDAIACLRAAGFELLAMRKGRYELAGCCPHVLLAKA